MTAFTIGEASVARGSRATVDLPVSTLSNHTRMSLPVHVVHGERGGPVMFLSAAIHGDEQTVKFLGGVPDATLFGAYDKILAYLGHWALNGSLPREQRRFPKGH